MDEFQQHKDNNRLDTISVIVPCYNAKRFIADTIQSAISQTHQPIEVIVVDDGSTDDSASIASCQSDLVRVFTQENQGESVARNVGIEQARGDWIAFLDADDQWHPEKLEKQLHACGPSTIASVTNLELFDAVNEKNPSWTEPPEVLASLEHICRFNAFLPSSLTVRKSHAPKFATWTQYGEDYLYSLDLVLAGEIKFIDLPLTRYRIHPQGQSSHPLSLVRQDRSFAEWIRRNESRLGQQRSASLRQIQVRFLTDRARLLRQTRDWERLDPLVEYLQELPSDRVISDFLSEKEWPRLAYRVVDIIDRCIPVRQLLRQSSF